MEITCYRDPEIAREFCSLPAATYNPAQTLLSRADMGCVFVPIRSMQYLAIIDAEEIVFIDSTHKEQVKIAWQNFRPQDRAALDQPVSYEVAYYCDKASIVIARLQQEFSLALNILSSKDVPTKKAPVIQLIIRDR
jgi:hypothetical protein